MIEEDRAALREALASALDREAGTQDALDDALRRVAELESHLEQSEQYRQAAQDERDRLARRVAELEAGRDAALTLLHGIDYEEESRVDRAVRVLAGDGGDANG